MKMFFQLAFVCSVGLFGCGSVSHANRAPGEAARFNPRTAIRATQAPAATAHFVAKSERPL